MHTYISLALLLSSTAFAGDVDRVPEDFPSIQDAVDHGKAPTIIVSSGDWAGATVTRKVALVGDGARITQGPSVGQVRAAFPMTEAATGSEVVGFTVDCNTSRLDLGVYSSSAKMGGTPDHINVANNRFLGCVQAVTNTGNKTSECSSNTVDGGRFWTVQNNEFQGFATNSDAGLPVGGIGVYLFNASDNDVFSNHFSGVVADTSRFTTSGVILAGCQDCIVASNEFSVRGGEHYWAAISNLGYYQDGAAPSERLLIADNNATDNDAPHHGVNFRSIDSFDVGFEDNKGGQVHMDHSWCGDGVKRLPRQARAHNSAKQR